MSDKVGTPIPASPAQAPAKKAGKAKTAKPRMKPTHPPTSDMVLAAIKNLKERNGSSLQAIKKYIVASYKIDVGKQAQFVKKFLVKAVNTGTLVRTKGKGASGSFRLAIKGEKAKSPKKVVAKKPAGAKKAAPKKKVVAVAAKKPTFIEAAKKPQYESVGKSRLVMAKAPPLKRTLRKAAKVDKSRLVMAKPPQLKKPIAKRSAKKKPKAKTIAKNK